MKSNKVIVITGSEGRVGSYVSSRFSEEGWTVAGLDIKEKNESSIHTHYVCDVRDYKAVEKTIQKIKESHGEIAVLFTAAGVGITQEFEETDIQEWVDVIETILGGTANLCQAVAPGMVEKKDGKIIILSPDYGWVEKESIMDATAAGTLHGFAKSFGLEVAESSVMVNALSPNIPFSLKDTADMVYFLAEEDYYTTAQVISINGQRGDVK